MEPTPKPIRALRTLAAALLPFALIGILAPPVVAEDVTRTESHPDGWVSGPWTTPSQGFDLTHGYRYDVVTGATLAVPGLTDAHTLEKAAELPPLMVAETSGEFTIEFPPKLNQQNTAILYLVPGDGWFRGANRAPGDVWPAGGFQEDLSDDWDTTLGDSIQVSLTACGGLVAGSASLIAGTRTGTGSFGAQIVTDDQGLGQFRTDEIAIQASFTAGQACVGLVEVVVTFALTFVFEWNDSDLQDWQDLDEIEPKGTVAKAWATTTNPAFSMEESDAFVRDISVFWAPVLPADTTIAQVADLLPEQLEPIVQAAGSGLTMRVLDHEGDLHLFAFEKDYFGTVNGFLRQLTGVEQSLVSGTQENLVVL